MNTDAATDSSISRSTNITTNKRLEGKVAVITGGASGIGASTVRLFIQHGAKVVVADIQDDLGHALLQEIGTHDDHGQENLTYLHCDVSSDSDVQNAVNTAVSKYGKLDIMFNNAGIPGSDAVGTSITQSDNEDFKSVFEVNVYGSFLGAKHAAKVMIPAKKGCILFTSSLASIVNGSPHAYTVSKHAVVGLMKSLAAELGTYGIRVNCLSPFGVATPIWVKSFGESMNKKKVEDLVSMVGNLKEAILEPEDVAYAALYLASSEAKYISGINFPVDGGYSLKNPNLGYDFQSMFPLEKIRVDM